MTRQTRTLATILLVTATAAAFPPPVKEKPDDPPPPATQADWRKSMNNLKLLAVAVHGYHDTYNAFPADLTDKNGKPLLSWRVRILPFLEQNDLFEKFKLDEAWDGPTNKLLIEKLPTVFATVRVKGKPGMTYYQGFAGPGTVFDPDVQPLRFAHVTDGLSNTALVVEAGTTTEWTRPGGLPFDAEKDLPRLGGHFEGEFAMALCDGSVVKVKKDFDARTMKAIVTRSGGEVFSLDGIRK